MYLSSISHILSPPPPLPSPHSNMDVREWPLIIHIYTDKLQSL